MATRPNPELDAFNRTIDHLLSVPREEMQKRIAEHKEEADKNPSKRGPKKKMEKTTA